MYQLNPSYSPGFTHVFLSNRHEVFEGVREELGVHLRAKHGRGDIEAGPDFALSETVRVLSDIVDQFELVQRGESGVNGRRRRGGARGGRRRFGGRR